jgi:DNA invertase Pin-like site-specific DNA recombinase
MKAALYLRVSTGEQTTENQERELRSIAQRMGHTIVEVYLDHGISGTKGREKRPAFDKLHKDASRRQFDIVMAWSVDRLGRSLRDLITFLDHLKSTGIDLYLHQQGVDTQTPAGRALFQMLGVFAEFERAIIVERVKSGMRRAAEKGTRSGKAIGRPGVPKPKRTAILAAYARTPSLRKVAKRFGVSASTVRNVLAA